MRIFLFGGAAALILLIGGLERVSATTPSPLLGEYYELEGFEIIDGRKVYTRGAITPISDIPWVPQPAPKVIYGTDDRIDYYQETDPDYLEAADSTCALVSNSSIVDNMNGTFTIQTSTYGVCASEPFSTQPTASFCTGFLVGPDLVATAGHCIGDAAPDLVEMTFVFGFHMLDATTPALTLPDANRYTGVKLVGHVLAGTLDYAVVKLDRPVTASGAVSLPIRRTGTVPNDTPVGVIGHPSGLPKKLAFGTQTKVYDNVATDFFMANLDTYGGNSGSPVFNLITGVVEGILVRGAQDFVFDADCGGYVSNVLADAAAAEEVTRTTTITQFVPDLPKSMGRVSFDEDSYRCEDTVTVEVADSDISGTTTVVLSTSNGDSETLMLTELGGSGANVFRGTIVTTQMTQSIENGTLEVADGGSITATYTDADDGTKSVAMPFDTAIIDCSPSPNYFTEEFSSGFDLEQVSITFTPDSSIDGYSACTRPASEIPTDMNGATTLSMSDDSFQQVTLTGGKTISIYGEDYTSCYVGSNGYVTFTGGDASFNPLIATHFSAPRVSGCFADLDPSSGGTIFTKQLGNRLVIGYSGVHTIGGGSQNSFQIELFFDGRIRLTFLQIGTTTSIVGLSGVSSTPSEYLESDLSTIADCDALALRNAFASTDTNDNGLLSLAESGLTQGRFDEIDFDNDNDISMAELLVATLGDSSALDTVYVDFDYIGFESGTTHQPFNSITEGVGYVEANGLLWLAPGSTLETIRINKAMTINRSGSSGVASVGP